MKHEAVFQLEQMLKTVAPGELAVVRHGPSTQDGPLPAARFSAAAAGKGRVEMYALFPGIEAAYHAFLADQIVFHHDASPSVLELFHCRSGRVGWNMRGDTAIYLGAGDMAAHSTACCADSHMLFPLGYAQGISFSVDLSCLAAHCPDIVAEAGVDIGRLQRMFCDGKPAAVSACPELDRIFAALYTARPEARRPYLKLKAQELLLYLNEFQSTWKSPTQYVSQQTERIQEIHRLLTEHPERRFTIEALSRRYSINTSTLKEAFKAVYGLPIASYMKEYRARQAMKLLRETDATVAEIAAQMGYETQGKFSKAFKDVAELSPMEYRKLQHGNNEPRTVE